MLTANVYDFKTKLSYYLDLVAKGKTVIISKRNVPIAEITPIKKIVPKRKLGQAEVKFEVPDSFFDPLPKKILEGFNNPK